MKYNTRSVLQQYNLIIHKFCRGLVVPWPDRRNFLQKVILSTNVSDGFGRRAWWQTLRSGARGPRYVKTMQTGSSLDQMADRQADTQLIYIDFFQHKVKSRLKKTVRCSIFCVISTSRYQQVNNRVFVFYSNEKSKTAKTTLSEKRANDKDWKQ